MAMETDRQFYELFKSNPAFLSDLLNLEDTAGYSFRSETFKSMERRVDGVFTHEARSRTWLIEFHGYRTKPSETDVYTATFAAMVSFMRANPQKIAAGIIVFLDPSHDPKTQPWQEIREAGLACFKVLYLEEILVDLAKRHPDHPLLDVFFPYLCADKKQLKQEARARYHKLEQAALPDQARQGAINVFVSWLIARMKNREEVEFMLAYIPPLEETEIGKELIDIGVTRGKVEGKVESLQTQIATYQALSQQGIIPEKKALELIDPLRRQLSELEAELARLQNKPDLPH